MAIKKEISAPNENVTTEVKPHGSVSEDGDLQGWDSQRNGDPSKLSSPPDQLAHEAIAKRAYELWHVNGCRSGFHEADWKQAEEELGARGSQPQQKPQTAAASGA